MSGGYYSVDVTDTVSVLVMSNEYFDEDADDSVYDGEPNEQLDWLEWKLSSARADGRKYIIAGHVYPGARYHSTQMWHSDYNERYF